MAAWVEVEQLPNVEDTLDYGLYYSSVQDRNDQDPLEDSTGLRHNTQDLGGMIE